MRLCDYTECGYSALTATCLYIIPLITSLYLPYEKKLDMKYEFEVFYELKVI